MMNTQTSGFKLVLALGLALSLAACSKKTVTSGLGADGMGKDGLGDSAGLAGSAAQVPGSAEDFAANIGDRVFFENDQTALNSESQATLLKQVAWLKEYPDVAIQIEGHADERGTRDYNLALSSRRATSVLKFMMSRGISGKRMSTVSFGKEKPAQLCDAEECWSQNRRAVTVITSGARTS